MTSTTADRLPRTASGVPLKLQLRRAERRRQLKAVGLVLPLFLFIIIAFVVPIGIMLFNSVHDDTLLTLMPKTTAALSTWDGKDLPDEAAYAALVDDLKARWKDKNAAEAGKRINYELPGARSQVLSSARKASKLTAGPYKPAMIAIDPIWGQPEIWSILKRGGSAYTPYYLLRSLDFQYGAGGQIVATPPENAIFRDIFARTLIISLAVTAATLLLGYPVAYLLASLPLRISNLLMIMVLLPFWTSLLVRTTAWVVLLQQHGVVNELLMSLHLIQEPADLIFNRVGTIVAMTHIQLPFTLLPIYSVMKTISPSHVRAARSLGAGPFYAFWRVYFPQTVPGIAAGCLLTFILCLGYYITPALVGGPTDQMVSYFVALYTNRELNWGMASALGAILLTATLILYYVYNKIIGVDRIKLGKQKMAVPVYASPIERIWYYLHRLICAAVLLFLISPILAIMPLSFNSVPFFTYPMPGFSLRWYEDFFLTDRWQGALQNSIFVACSTTVLATFLGTLAALGLSRSNFPFRTAVMSLLISPIVVPVVITAVGMYFFYADVGLLNSYSGLILAHTTLAAPFVVITVTATLIGFDHSLGRAAAGLGAPPITVFFKVILPLILPGMISGALFAFGTSFDEVVVVLFVASPEQRTLPKVMFSGIREMISPTITAAATVLILVSIAMLTTVELLRRRSDRLRGIRV